MGALGLPIAFTWDRRDTLVPKGFSTAEPYFDMGRGSFIDKTKWGVRLVSRRRYQTKAIGSIEVHIIDTETELDEPASEVAEYCTAAARKHNRRTHSAAKRTVTNGDAFSILTTVERDGVSLDVEHWCFTNGRALLHAQSIRPNTAYAQRTASRFFKGIRLLPPKSDQRN